MRCDLCGWEFCKWIPTEAGLYNVENLVLCRRCTERLDTGTLGILVMPEVRIIDWEGDCLYPGEQISVAHPKIL